MSRLEKNLGGRWYHGSVIKPREKGPVESEAQVSEQAPMGAHPPEAPRIDPVVKAAFQAVEPSGYRDDAESSVEAADFEVEDTIGGE